MTYCLDSAYLVRGFPNEAQLIAECADLIQANNIQYARHPLAEAQISKRNWRALECATTASSLRLNAGRIRVLQDRALLSKSKSAELYLEELIGSSESKLGDSIDYYAYAIALKLLSPNESKKIIDALRKSVSLDPANLPAAVALRELSAHTQDPGDLVTALGSLEPNETVVACQSVLESKPGLRCVRLRLGTALYRLNEFEKAESELRVAIYDGCLLWSISGADLLSDIMLLRRDSVALASLAADCFSTDRCAPETSFVMANYYQMQALQQTGEPGNFREKAALALQKAVQIRPDYAAGWLLLGHAFLELRNLPAAIHSYSRATQDSRSKSALANAYTLLGQNTFAEYYREKKID